MVTSQITEGQVRRKGGSIESIVAGVSEEKAKAAPAAGEWCVREVLTHLSGDADETFLQGIKRFVDENTPTLDLTPGTHLTSAGAREDAGRGSWRRPSRSSTARSAHSSAASTKSS